MNGPNSSSRHRVLILHPMTGCLRYTNKDTPLGVHQEEAGGITFCDVSIITGIFPAQY